MIFSIGEYVIDLVDDNNKFNVKYSGCGLITSIACMQAGANCAFLSPISNDINGIKIVNYLVEQEILFDPDLCNKPFNSPLCLVSIDEYKNIKKNYYLKNTAPMTLSSEDLLNALSNHSDIKAIHLGSLSMLINPTSSAILDVMSYITPRPNIYIDTEIIVSEVENIPNLRKKLYDFFAIAKMIKLNDNDILFLFKDKTQSDIVNEIREVNKSAHIIITKMNKASWITPKDELFEYDRCIMDELPKNSGAIFSGSLLAYLSNNGVFGDDGESPRFRIKDSIINESLKFACNKVKLKSNQI